MIIQLELSSFDPFLQFNLVLSTHRCTFYLEGLYLAYHIARSDEARKSLFMLLQKKKEETIECQLQYPSFEVCCIKVSIKKIWSCLAVVLLLNYRWDYIFLSIFFIFKIAVSANIRYVEVIIPLGGFPPKLMSTISA